MGVKDLWSIVSVVGERKSLWELQDKTLAIDLSGWVVSDNLCRADRAAQPRLYLRNLFFRTTCILLLGAHPVFVLEGMAPELKHDTIAKRRNVSHCQKPPSHSGRRSRLTSLQKQCQKILNIMGLVCVQSPGEAEAYCALLNQKGLVDGCVTQDGDAFLYGAQTVYRNFTISPSGNSSSSNAGFSVDVYRMHTIEEKLCLHRNDLIAISLLCGCDYNQKGIQGVGKESVLKFLSGVRGEDILSRLRRWRTDPYFDKMENLRSLITKGIFCEICGHEGKKLKHERKGCLNCSMSKGCSKDPSLFALSDVAAVAELNIRRKALLDPDFPSEAILNEFIQETSNDLNLDCTWRKPDILAFIKLAVQLLNWTEIYALEKFLPLVTRWQIQQDWQSKVDFQFAPKHIVKKRVLKGVESYEVQWEDSLSVLSSIEHCEETLITVEPRSLFEKAHPAVVEHFCNASKKPLKKGVRKKKEVLQVDNEDKENAASAEGVQTKLDTFFKVSKRSEQQNIETVFSKTLNKAHISEPTKERKNRGSCTSLSVDFSGLKISDLKSCKKTSSPCAALSSVSENEERLEKDPESSKYFSGKTITDVCSCNDSVCWETCPLCLEDESDLNLSEIIDDIVNKNLTSDVCRIAVAPLSEDPVSTIETPRKFFENLPRTSLDEFDLLAYKDNGLTLEERLNAQMTLK